VPDRKPTIFFSYIQRDKTYLDELLEVVTPTLRNVATLKPWSDRDIESGQDWESEIEGALDRAAAAVLLLSNAFLGSDFILKNELTILLPRHRSGALTLFTIYVTSVPKPALIVPLGSAEDDTFDLGSIQAENRPEGPLESIRDRGERTSIYAGLAEKLHALAQAQGRDTRSRRPGDHRLRPDRTGIRPECWIRLCVAGECLANEFLMPGMDRWLGPELRSGDALNALQLWQPGNAFEGDLLFELLFGADPGLYRELLSDPFGEDPGVVTEPPRWPWRLRLIPDENDDRLASLPWTKIGFEGKPLADSGWTVELAPPSPTSVRAELANHSFIMPGRILLVVPEAEGDGSAAAHLKDVQDLLQRLWDRPAPIFVASDAVQLGAYLRDYSPRLVYFYGRASRDGGIWTLRMADDSGLGFAAFKALFSSVPPSAVLLNLLGEDAVEAVSQVPILAEPPGAKLVAIQVTPRSQSEIAQGAAMAWLESVLSDDKRLDPVVALHGNGHAFAACCASYDQWSPQLGEAHLDEDLAHLLLDRFAQRGRVLQARDDFFDIYPNLMLQCFLALGVAGNRVGDFPRQAITHLQIHTRTGVRPYFQEIEILPTDDEPDRIEIRFRQRLGLKPSAVLADGLRPRQDPLSGEKTLSLLAWTLTGETSADRRLALAKAVVRWCRERLVSQLPEPDRLRVIVLIALETEDEDELEDLMESMETFDDSLTQGQDYRRTTAFRFEILEPLSGVRKEDLRKYFDSEYCSCPEGLRLEIMRRMLDGRRKLVFEQAVEQLQRGRRLGWHALLKALMDKPKDKA